VTEDSPVMSLHQDVRNSSDCSTETNADENLWTKAKSLSNFLAKAKRNFSAHESRFSGVESTLLLPDNGKETEETVKKTVAVMRGEVSETKHEFAERGETHTTER
jgi:hypothetical protein